MTEAEIRISERATPKQREEIQHLGAILPDLEAFCERWLRDPRHCMGICPAFNDEIPEEQSLAIILQDKEDGPISENPLAEIFFPLEWVRERYVGWRDIEDFVIGYDADTTETVFQDEALEAWESEVGLDYNYFFCCKLAPRTSLTTMVVAHVLSFRGDVHIGAAPEFYFDDSCPAELVLQGIGDRWQYRNLSAMNEGDRYYNGRKPGFMSNYMFTWESPNFLTALEPENAEALPI